MQLSFTRYSGDFITNSRHLPRVHIRKTISVDRGGFEFNNNNIMINIKKSVINRQFLYFFFTFQKTSEVASLNSRTPCTSLDRILY